MPRELPTAPHVLATYNYLALLFNESDNFKTRDLRGLMFPCFIQRTPAKD